MNAVMKVWNFFDRKKTVIGAIMFASHDILIAASAFYPVCADIATIAKEAAYIFTGAGLTHKAVKAVK